MPDPITLRQMDEKYGGIRGVSIALLYGKLTPEKEECARLYMNPTSILLIASEGLLRLNTQFLAKIDAFTGKPNAG